MVVKFKDLIQNHEKAILDHARRIEQILDDDIKKKFNGYEQITISLRVTTQIPTLVIKKLKELYFDWNMDIEEDNTDNNLWVYTIYMKGKLIEQSYR